ncbi:MAG: DUF1338 domain-containing protein [Alphaproteobacteria bacterium HGW-Alphaproteobacteria-18]|nr:MAG: DUF1338 domain-containing protein [Alphaproteobacteria bacterium HGW-Alphaproteobacteria-18]
MSDLISAWRLRQMFTLRLSKMYCDEVPAYGRLIDVVNKINRQSLSPDVSDIRHGAIRLALPDELSLLRRAFRVLGMHPVGYYDLATAGLPVHSTAFRPLTAGEIGKNPFRLFASLVRLDQIASPALQRDAKRLMEKRSILAPQALAQIEQAERKGGLTHSEGELFLSSLIETFRWRGKSVASRQVYEAMIAEHPLLADVLCFENPHINHLTPHVSDIDAAQSEMIAQGLPAKKKIEGPPQRKCPVLLRQTAFRALEETVRFAPAWDGADEGAHTARFGEIEQRGAALTARGMTLYDDCLSRDAFADLPDDWDTLRRKGLAWFRYTLTPDTLASDILTQPSSPEDFEDLLKDGILSAAPIVYEDFLPVSAAGIFHSNLKQAGTSATGQRGNKDAFEQALGSKVHDPQAL